MIDHPNSRQPIIGHPKGWPLHSLDTDKIELSFIELNQIERLRFEL